MNDLGLISGIFLIVILLVLNVELAREITNLDRAKARAEGAKSAEKQRDGLELLLMTQVLAEKRGPTYGVHILLLAVMAIYGWIAWSDVSTYESAVQLQGRSMATLETALVVALCLFVWILCVLVARNQDKLDNTLNELEKDVEKSDAQLERSENKVA